MHLFDEFMDPVTPLTKVGLLIIGDEILLGRRVDKHFPRGLAFFSEIGVDIGWVSYLGDDLSLLVEQFQAIEQRGGVCFSFGGIGATPDDVTRQAVAEACGRPLMRHPEAVRLIETQFGAEAYPNRILMAELPAGASLIPNAFNNIPGFSVGEIHCLPGFPEMAWPMLEWVIGSRYRVAVDALRRFASLIIVDVRESELIGVLTTVQQRYARVRISSLPRFPEDGRWLVELGVRGPAGEVDEAMGVLREELQRLQMTIQESL